MHAVKSLISTSKILHLNLASNMISEVGLSLILEEMIKNTFIHSLDLGILEGSIRKNSFGIDGARCLAAILLQNKKL
jgi:mannose/fructose/N-acetylgalactosamine-specific phosphotransferase system component IIC